MKIRSIHFKKWCRLALGEVLAVFACALPVQAAAPDVPVYIDDSHSYSITSTWDNGSADAYIGVSSNGNTLTITAPGTLIGVIMGYIGDASANNTVTVTGAGATWNLSSYLYVGNAGSFNRLNITGGASVTNYNGIIGNDLLAHDNRVWVTGSGSIWDNSGGDVLVGNCGYANSLTINNGGQVFGGNSFIGITDPLTGGAYNNSVYVSGSGSIWRNSADLYVGCFGYSNSLIIDSGGMVSNSFGFIGYDDGTMGSSSNKVLVTGAGSIWSNAADLVIGHGNGSSSNNLTISAGGVVYNNYGTIGKDFTANNNSVLVTGSGSIWSNSLNLYVGETGCFNSLTIASGGMVFSANAAIGSDANANNNRVLVTGAGSGWTNSGDLWVGWSGSSNSLTLANSGRVANANGYIGDGTVASNNAVVVAGGAVWSGGDLFVGNNGSYNSLAITNGGQVSYNNSYIGRTDSANNNSALVSGIGSSWRSTNSLFVGDSGTGSQLTVSDNGTVAALCIVAGNTTTSIGNVITVSGGNLYATNAAGTGALEIRRGSLTFNSGTVTVNRFYATNFASSVVSFNGGTLNSGGSTVNNSSLFRVGNGLSSATLHLLGGSHSFANGLFINTNSWLTGTGAITGVITNAGTIAPGDSPGILAGSGNLTLLGSSLLQMQLAGTNNGLYDQINIAGTMSFGGALTLSLLDGFTVSAGDRFDLFDFSVASGAFSTTNLPDLDALLYWDMSALYTTGEIEVEANQTGSLQVNLTPQAAIDAGAKWQVDADGNWHSSGETVSALVSGNHTVSYTNLTGWIKPTNQVVQISSGTTTVTNGNYELVPLLLAAVSRKTHGVAGDYDLSLNLDGVPSATIEPRLEGPNKVVFTFNKAVAAVDGVLSANEFTLTNATYSSASIVGSNLTLNLASVVDQSQVTVVLKGIGDLAGNALSGTNAVRVSVLYGDVNQSGSVNVTDRQAVKSRLMQVLSNTNFLYDANASGSVNVTDRQVVKANLYHTVNMNGLNALLTAETVSNATVLSAATMGEALGAPELAWSSDGDAEWAPAIASDGSSAACSGNIGDLNVSWVETTVSGPGTLSFEWAVSSEADADYLTFSIDGVDQSGRISGEVDWQTLTFNIPSGTHRLTWTYAKNGSKAVGLDVGWLRRVVYETTP